MTRFFALFLALCVLSCSEGESLQENESMARISGSVTYRERIALSPEAVLEISLADVSRADAPAVVIASRRLPNPGQVPISFELPYPSGEIDQRMSYAVQAKIFDRGRLRFISDHHTPVLTRGAPERVEMTLARVRGMDAGQGQGENPQTARESAEVALEGMFRYMADAALFRDCRNGRVYPVSMEGAYIDLERAYLGSEIEPGSEVLVRLTGRYLERPAMEGDRNAVKLVVDSLGEVLPGESCEPSTHAGLRDTYWKLVEVDGRAVSTAKGAREAHLVLESGEARARGHAGCNNFFGGFSAEGNSLEFSGLGSTMMACPSGMDTEQAFLRALGETSRFEISGESLRLFAGDRLLARFEAVYF